MKESTPSRAKSLSAEDKLLWWHITRGVTPRAHDAERVEAVGVAEPVAPAPEPLAAPPPKAKAPAHPREALDARLKRKVSRGTQAIDARLDLHGLTQEGAHRALMQFLRQSQALERRLVIVITGKGQPYLPRPLHDEPFHWNPGLERGVLKRLVPHWLKMGEFRPYVVGFESAGRGHGGDGALYVHVRRLRG